MARLIHQLRSDDTDETFSVLRAARERLQGSGARRLAHTLPPIAFCAIRMVGQVKEREDSGEKVEASCKTVRLFFDLETGVSGVSIRGRGVDR